MVDGVTAQGHLQNLCRLYPGMTLYVRPIVTVSPHITLVAGKTPAKFASQPKVLKKHDAYASN